MHMHGQHYFSTGLWLVHSAPERKAGSADCIQLAVTPSPEKNQSAHVVLYCTPSPKLYTYLKNSNDFDMRYKLDAVADHWLRIQ